MKEDIYKIWDGKKFRLTLNKVAKIAGFDIPACFSDIADNEIGELIQNVVSNNPAKKGVHLCFQYHTDAKETLQYSDFVKQGGVLISNIKLLDNDGTELPMILLPSLFAVQEAWHALGSYIKDVFDLPTIALTGSVGKTTLTLILESIFKERYNVFTSGGNLNTVEYFIRQMFRNYDADKNFHIQECGGGYPTCVERSAKIMKPDAFIIANILPHHLDKYKDLDGVFFDKAALDRHAKDNAFGVINIDDDMLRNSAFKHKTVTCGIKHNEADYVAENIWCDKELHLDVVHGEEKVNVKIQIPGLHNAYNVLLAFAMAKEFGFSNEEIVKGLKNYQSGDIRQNIREVSGRIFYIDCFNICAASVYSGVSTLNEMKPAYGGRRIAVLGGENALGDKSYSVNYEIGLNLAQYKNIDEYIFFGPSPDEGAEKLNKLGNAYAVYEGAKKVLRGKKLSFISDLEKIAEKLVNDTKKGDIIFFKSIIYLPIFPMFDMAFGTSYVNYSPYLSGSVAKNDVYTSTYYPQIDGCNISACKVCNEKLQIPNFINDKPVHRIGRGLYENKKQLCEVDFGKSVMNIGSKAFSGTSIKNIVLPSNVIHVEKEAFANCENLETAKFIGVEHLEEGVFKNCKNLKTVEIPETCLTIEENVFEGCGDVTIIAPRDSYAAEHAEENGIKIKWSK